jgi:hypothetical protein
MSILMPLSTASAHSTPRLLTGRQPAQDFQSPMMLRSFASNPEYLLPPQGYLSNANAEWENTLQDCPCQSIHNSSHADLAMQNHCRTLCRKCGNPPADEVQQTVFRLSRTPVKAILIIDNGGNVPLFVQQVHGGRPCVHNIHHI